MNILLTEIRSLTLELSGLPEALPEEASSFTRLFQQQLPKNSDAVPQAVDFNEVYVDVEVPVASFAGGVQSAPAAAWREFLARDPVRISSDSMPLNAIPVEFEPLAAGAVPLAAQPVAAARPALGDLLPRGGKSLPDTELTALAPAQAASRPQVAVELPAPSAASQPGTAAAINPGVEAKAAAVAAVTPPPDLARVTPPPQLLQQQAVRQPDPGSETTIKAAIEAGRTAMENRNAARNAPVGDAQARAATTLPPVTAAAPAQVKPVAASSLPPVIDSSRPPTTAARPPVPVEAAPRPAPAAPIAAAATRPASIPTVTLARSENLSGFTPVDRADSLTPAVSAPRAAGNEAVVDRAVVFAERPAIPARTMPESVPMKAAPLDADVMPAGEFRDGPRTQLATAAQSQDSLPAQNAALRSAEPMPGAPAPSATTAAVTPSAPAAAVAPQQAVPVPGETLPPQLETLQLPRQADGKDWGNGLGERVQWMINQKQNSAMIRLDPPALGKLDVQVKIAEDATTITIQAQHAQTRDLIESASHRLRDFLQESGYQNVNVDVSQRHDQQQARAQSGSAQGDESTTDADAETGADEAREQRPDDYLQGDGLLDTFA